MPMNAPDRTGARIPRPAAAGCGPETGGTA